MKSVVEVLAEKGGRVYYVGGTAINIVTGNAIALDNAQDIDIEVFGLSIEDIESYLVQAGFEVDAFGKSFGILKTGVYEIGIPRRENRIGVGHKDFTVECDPTMTIEHAARRRDLTINAIYVDASNGAIHDPYGGLMDLRKGIIRCVNPATFMEDPLRVLRAAQILARKGRYVDMDTLILCRKLAVDDVFKSIPVERIGAEIKKLLMLAPRPSIGFEFLRACRWLRYWPELDVLISCPQHPKWHPEGNVWNHTMECIDRAAALLNTVPDEWKYPFMLGVLCHDMGKLTTTNTDTLTAYGHPEAGVSLAIMFLKSALGVSRNDIDKAVAIVRNHMDFMQMYTKNEAKDGAWKRLHNRLPLPIAAAVALADYPNSMDVLTFAKYKVASWNSGFDKIPPVLTGYYLISKGLEPGPKFKIMLDTAYDIQISEDITDREILWSRINTIHT